jgi:phospholipid transport system substrate-binding protein
VTAEILDASGDKKLASGTGSLLKLAEEGLRIDFEEATRLAVGRSGASSPEQKKKLITEFRRMLVRVYSNAIQPYAGQTIQVAPVRMKPGDTDATVHNTFKRAGGGQPVGFDYSMRKTEQGWKIYDIVVEGVSLVLTYHSEFDGLVKQEGVAD